MSTLLCVLYSDKEKSSLVTAHLSAEGILSAVIVTLSDTYHVEPSHHYIREPHPFHMVAYAKSRVKERLNTTMFDYTVPPPLPSASSPEHHNFASKHKSHTLSMTPTRRLRRQTVNRGNIGGDSCDMILIADFTAFTMFIDVQSTVSQLVGNMRVSLDD